jgi:mono/diheme cytochrome c family protein
MFLSRIVLSTLLFVPAALLAADSEVKINKTPVVFTPPSSGPEMFAAYCASCHGTDAKGRGPAASALKAVPRDLTVLSKENHGKFPAFHVEATIRGDDNLLSHGSKDMPVWGFLFSSMDKSSPMGEKAYSDLRIANLTRYIESLQQK